MGFGIGIRKSWGEHSKVGSFMIPFSLEFGPQMAFSVSFSQLLAVNPALNEEHRSIFTPFEERERED